MSEITLFAIVAVCAVSFAVAVIAVADAWCEIETARANRCQCNDEEQTR